MRPVQPLGTPPFDGGSGLAHIDWIRWWGDLAKAVENLSTQTYAPVTPSPLTRANDTNVTVTLTGSPTVALLAPVLMTMGWTGVLAVSRGGTGTGTTFTAGSVIFAGPLGVYAQDNANLFWDDTNNRLGIGTAAPAQGLHFSGGTTQNALIETLAPLSGYQLALQNSSPTVGDHQAILAFRSDNGGGAGIMVNRWLVGNSVTDEFLIVGIGGTRLLIDTSGRVGIGVAVPTGALHLKAGTTAASTAPLKFTSGSLLTTAEAGAMEFLTDGYFLTITTGAARKGILLNDGTTLTAGRVPFVTTAGRLTDDADLTFATDTLSATKVLAPTSVSTPSLISTTALTITPASGSNLNVSLATTGDFAVNTSQLYVDTSATDVGIGTTTPQASLEILRGTGSSSVPAVIRLSNNADTIAAGDTIGRIDFFSGDNSGGGDSVICKIVATQRTTTPVDGELGFFVGSAAATEAIHIISTGRVGFQVASPTAILHLKAGTTAASTAPLKFNSGSLLTTAEAGAVEFLTDGYYATITTGAARKGIVLDDGTALTSGRVPFATTNGRLTDDADLTFATDTLTTTKLVITNKLTSYNGVATAGWGEPAIYGSGRSTAQVAAVASVAAYTCGVADGSFVVSMNVNVTTSTTHNFTAECAYTDETNTARVLTLTFSQLAGVFVTAITNVTGAGPYEGVPMHIRVKASTAITLRTQAAGTYTTVTYNVEGLIQQVA